MLRIDAWSEDRRERVLYRGPAPPGVRDALQGADFLHLVYTARGRVCQSKPLRPEDLDQVPWISPRHLNRMLALMRLELGTGRQNLN